MSKRATLYRMQTPQSVCPSGLRAKALLAAHGFTVEDKPLPTRAAVDAFKAEHSVETTPQVFIDGERIGGYDATRAHLGLAPKDPNATTYAPVIAVFAVAALLALAVGHASGAALLGFRGLELFIGFAMALLGLQKLRDVDGFATSFLTYDLLARREPRYAYVYPFIETGVGVAMVAGALGGLVAPLALIAGAVGAASVWRAVYVEKRALRCACVGGASRVPLGPVSLGENVVMAAMGATMLAQAAL